MKNWTPEAARVADVLGRDESTVRAFADVVSAMRRTLYRVGDREARYLAEQAANVLEQRLVELAESYEADVIRYRDEAARARTAS